MGRVHQESPADGWVLDGKQPRVAMAHRSSREKGRHTLLAIYSILGKTRSEPAWRQRSYWRHPVAFHIRFSLSLSRFYFGKGEKEKGHGRWGGDERALLAIRRPRPEVSPKWTLPTEWEADKGLRYCGRDDCFPLTDPIQKVKKKKKENLKWAIDRHAPMKFFEQPKQKGGVKRNLGQKRSTSAVKEDDSL